MWIWNNNEIQLEYLCHWFDDAQKAFMIGLVFIMQYKSHHRKIGCNKMVFVCVGVRDKKRWNVRFISLVYQYKLAAIELAPSSMKWKILDICVPMPLAQFYSTKLMQVNKWAISTFFSTHTRPNANEWVLHIDLIFSILWYSKQIKFVRWLLFD